MLSAKHVEKNALGLTLREEQQQQRHFLFGNGRYWIHIATWIFCGLFIYLNNSFKVAIDDMMLEYALQERVYIKFQILSTLLGMVIAGATTYFFLLKIVPYARWKMKRRYIWLYVFFTFFFIFFLLFSTSVFYGLTKQFFVLYIITLIGAIFLYQLTFISIFYYLYLYDKQRVFKAYEESLEKRLEAEAEFLASQINPHFLFNTINNIYAQTLTDTNAAKESISKLESLIHYIHTETQQEWIALDDEIEFIKSYLSLELLRNKANQVHFIFETDGVTRNKKIAPLLLINFIENAFKHGVKIDDQKSFVHIRIDVYKNYMHFSISNSRSKSSINTLNKKSGGIGLRNVKRRLELVYPRKHKLRIKKNKHQYKVSLTLYQI